jgi:hypothetical protein
VSYTGPYRKKEGDHSWHIFGSLECSSGALLALSKIDLAVDTNNAESRKKLSSSCKKDELQVKMSGRGIKQKDGGGEFNYDIL